MSKTKETIVASYWNDPNYDPRYVGVYPIGTGKTVEIPYRHHEEWAVLSRRLPPPPFSLLELGCGAGRWAFSLAPLVNRYVGLDLSTEQIGVAREHAARNSWDHLKFIVGDIMDYDPGEETFDCIYLSGVAMYIEDDKLAALLSRLNAWLKPGGLLVERDTVFVGSDRHVRNDGRYFAIYRLRDEIIAAFAQAGFAFVEDVRSYSLLRTRDLWQNPALCEFMQWGVTHLPAAAFALMRGYSDFVSGKTDPYCHEGDKTYDHRFFFTAPKN
ncbi:MAG: class I SAM-dependent methyltransferase [Deltaproteobacteria bacterium]|jgi:SAM-dependent methyltransferase|nr:class I SAM-dependent methyltransferase [Deltaproteobacteria bacterium]